MYTTNFKTKNSTKTSKQSTNLIQINNTTIVSKQSSNSNQTSHVKQQLRHLNPKQTNSNKINQSKPNKSNKSQRNKQENNKPIPKVKRLSKSSVKPNNQKANTINKSSKA